MEQTHDIISRKLDNFNTMYMDRYEIFLTHNAYRGVYRMITGSERNLSKSQYDTYKTDTFYVSCSYSKPEEPFSALNQHCKRDIVQQSLRSSGDFNDDDSPEDGGN